MAVETTVGHVRVPRFAPPQVPGGEVTITAPPELTRPVPAPLLVRLLPVVMVVAVVGMVAMLFLTGGRGMLTNPMFLMFPLMMVMSMVGMLAGGGRGGAAKSAELAEERKDYLRYLANLRDQVRRTVTAQHEAAQWVHPEPAALPAVVGGARMWERRPADTDFGHLRFGVGMQRLATRLAPPGVAPPEDLDPVATVALRRFLHAYSAVEDLPTAVALRGFPAVAIDGDPDRVRGLLRAVVAQLCTWHGPDHVMLAVVSGDPAGGGWDWVKWLPHTAHPDRRDGAGAQRMCFPTLLACEGALSEELSGRGRFSRAAPPSVARPHLVVVLDGPATGDEELIAGPGRDGVTLLHVGDFPESLAARRGLQLVLDGERLKALSVAGSEDFARADQLGVAEALVLARRLARYRVASSGVLIDLDEPLDSVDPGLPALLGIPDAYAFDPPAAWRGRTGADRLRVPIGVTPDGRPVELDLKESAAGGMGPHGLCIGATGSGKSELLRTLVLSLVATHSPGELNLVLVDFKGGATFLGLEPLRHVSAIITNLEQELSMVDRMADALSGELQRRQELLRAAGNFANVGEYERARAAGAPLTPLPALLIVVDEFSELLSQKPEFAELFVAIGRLGRSLHIHLLLASQRLEEGRLRGLDSHLSYRIGLKTFSANESRTVLGVPDAYHLPSVPGSAYLKCDSGEPLRFTTSFVSGPYRPPGEAVADGASWRPAGRITVLPFTAAPVPIPEPAEPGALPAGPGPEPETAAPEAAWPSLLDVLAAAMAGHGPAPHRVWLPPLDGAVTLGELVSVIEPVPLCLPLGVIDRPREQRRDVLLADLRGAAGNVAIAGGPRSGKSTALRTLICAAALRHGPGEVQFYCLDFGGGGLGALAGLPHVGGVAARGRRDAVRRTVAELQMLLAQREEVFTREGFESMAQFRERAAASGRTADGRTVDGQTADGQTVARLRTADVFLVIDGLGVLRSEFELLEEPVLDLAGRGLAYGIHVVVTASRWAEVRPAMKDLMGCRVELRLGDALDSEVSRKAAAAVPADRPGRGLAVGELHMLIALPRADGVADAATLAEGTAQLVEGLVRKHPQERAPRVRMLAPEVSAAEIAARCAAADLTCTPGQLALGLGEAELAPVLVDLARDPHLLVFADAESGKTELLRTLVTGLARSGGPDEVKVVLVDYRRTLLGAVDEEHLAGYASSAQSAAPMMAELAQYLAKRLPGEDVTQQQLRDRSWWTGPGVYLVVDDYDLVATPTGNPLLPLVELLGQARDIGLSLVLARRSGGLGRAMFDPVIARLRDLSCDVFLGSGDPDEGYIVGRHRLAKLPPGRGELISRNRPPQLVQVALTPPRDLPEPDTP